MSASKADLAATVTALEAAESALAVRVVAAATALTTAEAALVAGQASLNAAQSASLQSQIDRITAVIAALNGVASGTGTVTPPAATDPIVVGTPAAPGSQDSVTLAKRSPYPTLGAALLAVKSGGTILVADGTYKMAEIGFFVSKPATIKAVNTGKVTFDGEQCNAGGTGGKPRAVFGKAVTMISGAMTISLIGIKWINAGDPSDAANVYAAVYYEQGASVVLQDTEIDASCDGVFGGALALDYTGIRAQFGRTASNGLNQAGYSHDVYGNGRAVTETDCFHYGCIQGHALKSRALTTTITGGLYIAHDNAAINMPQGGKVQVTGAYIDMLAGANANLITMGDDGPINGPTMANVAKSTIVARRNPCLVTLRDAGGVCAYTNCVQAFPGGGVIQIVGAVTGLLTTGPLTTAPARPTIPAAA